MRLLQFSVLVLQASALALDKPSYATVRNRDEAADDAELISTFAQAAFEQSKMQSQAGSDTCSLGDIKIRREWGSLSEQQRAECITAVKCLQSRPALTPESVAPGAKTRFDDFVATHINQTTTIHYTGNFLVWHRYYTWLYEEALRSECGHTGTQPAKTAETGLEASPIFDGSSTSMSGNGEPIANQPDIVLGATGGLPPITLPPGSGGGCVTSGPFKDMIVNLGPAALDPPGGVVDANPSGPLSYNPRCLKRSLTDEINRDFASASAVLPAVRDADAVDDFQMRMQGVPGTGDLGVHGGGHYVLGGDPGRDVFVSPGDPAFYLHHSMIDRVWWIWQMLDPQPRTVGPDALSGTNTFLDDPPSAETTFDDYVGYGYAAGPPRRIRDLMSTVAGPFCYVYL